jgi:subtilisin-like proprotein convertase family protein
MNFQVTIPAGGTLVVVVMEANAGTTCAYTGTVSGLIGDIDGGGECGACIQENFDGVTPPALPAGWTATNAQGPAPLWETSNSGDPMPSADTPPNAAFVDCPAVRSDKRLDSPPFSVAATNAQLTFRNNYDLQDGSFDGGVLEISIDGGAFVDILTARGSFVTGGYTGTLNNGTGNPIGGRRAWIGTSGGFITTTVNLPSTAAGHMAVLRWRLGSDDVQASVGWRIDTISTTGCSFANCPPNIFRNSTPITIPDSGAASPYPSDITVSGVSGSVTKVTVSINGLSHTFPDDIDILLVGPGGDAIIMSDAGNGFNVNNVTLTFDDAAAASLPDEAQIVRGIYQPTNYEGTDPFPAPAPAPSGNSALSVFNGTNPNGTWSLYVVDDASGDVGQIAGGWTLRITTDACP